MTLPVVTNLPRPNTPKPETLDAAAIELRIQEIKATIQDERDQIIGDYIISDYLADLDDEEYESENEDDEDDSDDYADFHCLICGRGIEEDVDGLSPTCPKCERQIKRLSELGYSAKKMAAQIPSLQGWIEFVLKKQALEDELAQLISMQESEVKDA